MTSILSFENAEILNKFGKNWTQFNAIFNNELQLLKQYIYASYDNNNVGTMSDEIINLEIAANDIQIVIDTINAKRSARRHYVSNFKRKLDPNVYLDLAEAIVGIRGNIYSGYDIAANIWDESTWPEDLPYEANAKVWPGDFPFLEIWINVKTNDPTMINRILEIYRSPVYRPAFKQIYLTDDSLMILGVV